MSFFMGIWKVWGLFCATTLETKMVMCKRMVKRKKWDWEMEAMAIS